MLLSPLSMDATLKEGKKGLSCRKKKNAFSKEDGRAEKQTESITVVSPVEMVKKYCLCIYASF